MNENKRLELASVRSVKRAGKWAEQQGRASQGSPPLSLLVTQTLQHY